MEALPLLLRRIAGEVGLTVDVPRPIRVAREKILKGSALRRAVELAALRAGPEGHILILVDADDDCPKDLAAELLEEAAKARSDRQISVVVAKSEYESWFLAATGSIAESEALRSRSFHHATRSRFGTRRGGSAGGCPLAARTDPRWIRQRSPRLSTSQPPGPPLPSTS